MATEKIVGAPFDCAWRGRAATVIGFVKQRAAGFAAIDGNEHAKVRGELDFAGGISRRKLKIDDLLIGFVARIEREVDRAGPLLVRAGFAARLATRVRLALGNVPAEKRNMGDLEGRRRNDYARRAISTQRREESRTEGAVPLRIAGRRLAGALIDFFGEASRKLGQLLADGPVRLIELA